MLKPSIAGNGSSANAKQENFTMSASVPLISVGLPVYNGEGFLAQTLDSILSQTLTDFELIISDNGSVDGSRAIAESYARRDGRVQVVQSDINRGAAWNYKRVLDLARGPYFRWAPADDLFAPESLACCVEVLDQHPEAILCYPKTTLIDAHGGTIRPYDDNLDLRQASPVDRYKAVIKQLGLTNVIYGLMRTDVLRQTRLIGNFPGADLIFVAELSLFGQFHEIDRPLFFRRMHEGASSSIRSEQGVQAFMDPQVRRKRRFARRWYHLVENMRSVLHGPIKTSERVRLLFFLLRAMIASRDELLNELLLVMKPWGQRVSRL
ncbi:MAG: glycosyltransferase [Nitrospira sp.]|nr:glycosyltransferase [Nitrospira sp.]